MKLNKLTAHPDNNKIYSPTDLDDLEKSLSEFGQLEPIRHNQEEQNHFWS